MAVCLGPRRHKGRTWRCAMPWSPSLHTCTSYLRRTRLRPAPARRLRVPCRYGRSFLGPAGEDAPRCGSAGRTERRGKGTSQEREKGKLDVALLAHAARHACRNGRACLSLSAVRDRRVRRSLRVAGRGEAVSPASSRPSSAAERMFIGDGGACEARHGFRETPKRGRGTLRFPVVVVVVVVVDVARGRCRRRPLFLRAHRRPPSPQGTTNPCTRPCCPFCCVLPRCPSASPDARAQARRGALVGVHACIHIHDIDVPGTLSPAEMSTSPPRLACSRWSSNAYADSLRGTHCRNTTFVRGLQWTDMYGVRSTCVHVSS